MRQASLRRVNCLLQPQCRLAPDPLDADWPEVAYCVGVFRLEGPGVQLFDTIEGDHFTIFGLPLLPLLGEGW